MVAAQEGKDAIVQLLLQHKADIHALDMFGNNALVGAVKQGHTKSVDILVAAGSSLVACTSVILGDVVDCIKAGDVGLLIRYMVAGTDPDLSDHHKCTLLHVAAGEGSLPSIKVLVDSGANVMLLDKWGRLPLDEAKRVGAQNIVQFLEPLVAKAEAQMSKFSGKRSMTGSRAGSVTGKSEEAPKVVDSSMILMIGEMLDAASKGEAQSVSDLLRKGVNASCCDYDKRSALMVSAQGEPFPIC